MSEALPRPFGDFVLLKSLGAGAMGDVHLAQPTRKNWPHPSPVVIKRLHAELLSKQNLVQRFEHEAMIARLVDDVHVAKVFESGIADSTPYIAMEYVAGWSLARMIDALRSAGGGPPLSAVLDIVRGVLLGLSALHDANIVHRDVSPRNVMIGEDGSTHLIDLGIGKSEHREWRTQTGYIVGSPGYMSPEQLMAARDVDVRADLYAVAALLFELLTMQSHIPLGPITEMIHATLNPRFVPPSTIRPDLPADFDRIVEMGLAVDRERRFASARAFLAVLDRVPARAGPRAIDLIDGLLWSELLDQRTEMKRLVSDVFRPTVDAPASEIEPTALVTRMQATKLVLRGSSAQPANRPRSTTMLILAFAVTVPLILCIGVMLDRAVFSPSAPASEVIEIPTTELKAPDVPRASQRASDEARVEPDPAPVQVPPREKHIAREPRHEPMAVKPATTPMMVELDPVTLIDRAKRIGASATEPAAKEALEEIRRQLMKETSASEDERKDRVRALAKKLDAIEARAREGNINP